MYKVGEYVVCGNAGICMISEITKKCFDGKIERLYYTLNPLEENKGTVYTPVENTRVVLRNTISKENALALIDRMKGIETIWEENERNREKRYQGCIQSGDCDELVKVIKTLYLRKQTRIKVGKKLAVTDEKFLKTSENRLFEELAFALEKEKEEMKEFITERIKRLK